MASLLKKIHRLFRHSGTSESSQADLDAAVQRALEPIRSTDPDTHRQWAHLAARLASEPATASSARPLRAAVAAVAVIAIAATALVVTSREPSADRYVTARGEQTSILLPDSSNVTLNHTSELSVTRFTPGEPRRMTLSGEALFRVQKNGSPFIVSSGSAEIAVVGTEFNVRSRDGLLEVAVLRGAVRVARADGGSGLALTLTAGQRASVRREEDPVRLDDIPSPEFPGWLHGKLYLTTASLAEACREIEARFDVSVRIIGPSSDEITGVLEATSADVALRSLGMLTGKTMRRDHGTYTLE